MWDAERLFSGGLTILDTNGWLQVLNFSNPKNLCLSIFNISFLVTTYYCKVWPFIMVLNIFTIVNIKKGPTITDSASYSMSSCPFSIVIAIPEWFNDFSYTYKNNRQFFKNQKYDLFKPCLELWTNSLLIKCNKFGNQMSLGLNLLPWSLIEWSWPFS